MHHVRRVFIGAVVCAAASAVVVPATERARAAAPACQPDNGGIKLPDGFCAVVAADALGPARHVAVAPNGDVYVAIQQNRSDTAGVVALRDTDGDGRLDQKEVITQAGGGTGVAIRNEYLYLATPTTVVRWKMTKGQLKPTGDMETIVTGFTPQFQHQDKGIAFDGKGGLYVNVGAPSNACQNPDRQKGKPGQDPCPLLEQYGGVWKFDENKPNQKQADGTRWATGLRQMPAITWHDDNLYIVMNNRDSV